MTTIAPHISEFLQERLPVQRGASSNTCDSYSYSFQLLFEYAAKKYHIEPYKLSLEQIDAKLVMQFLEYLEVERKNTPRTRNARLIAIKSFMKFVQYRVPSLLNQVQTVLAIPSKKTDQRLVNYLTLTEMKTILDQPDMSKKSGIRDRAMINLCFSAGLRVSELVELEKKSITFSATPCVRIVGKGRRERVLPVWPQTAEDLKAWIKISEKQSNSLLFLNARNHPLSRSGFEYILKKYVVKAKKHCQTLADKVVSPHVLRHTSAMLVLQATGDIRKVSLWLGHSSVQSTEAYLRADPTEKLDAIAAVIPPSLKPGKFKIPDKLIALLKKQKQ